MKNPNKKINILNKEYNRVLKSLVYVPEERWDIYSEIISECVEYLGPISFEEIKYYITDGMDINDVMLFMLNKLDGGYYLKLVRDINVFINQDWVATHTNFKKR